MAISDSKNMVISILKSSKLARNDDYVLYCYILNKYYSFDVSNNTVSQLFRGIADDKYPRLETITRCRRKVQEDCEHLRGSNYKNRNEKQTDVKADIKNNF